MIVATELILKQDPPAATSFSSSFTEILAGWDSVLKVLDEVNTFTSERAGEASERLLETCRNDRPSQWSSDLSPLKSTRDSKAKFTTHPEVSFGLSINASDIRAVSSKSAAHGTLLARLEQRFGKEERLRILSYTFREWKEVKPEAESNSKASNTEADEEIKSLRDKLEEASSIISSLKAEVASAKSSEASSKLEVQQLGSSNLEVVASLRNQVGELSMRLARSEAEVSETKADLGRYESELQKMQSSSNLWHQELEVIYKVLSGMEGMHSEGMKVLKGSIRDREVALMQLYTLLQRSRPDINRGAYPPVFDEAAAFSYRPSPTSSETTPSEIRLTTSLSLPSLTASTSDGTFARSMGPTFSEKKRRWPPAWH